MVEGPERYDAKPALSIEQAQRYTVHRAIAASRNQGIYPISEACFDLLLPWLVTPQGIKTDIHALMLHCFDRPPQVLLSSSQTGSLVKHHRDMVRHARFSWSLRQGYLFAWRPVSRHAR
jgi:hypothetical protein